MATEPVVVGPQSQPTKMTPSEELFFAEEFTARRRRFIPLTVDLKKIASEGIYKNYKFGFAIPVEKPENPSSYPELFPRGDGTRFSVVTSYEPTTHFEALSYELYKDALRKVGDRQTLETTRALAVDTLLGSKLLLNLDSLPDKLHPPSGAVPFGRWPKPADSPPTVPASLTRLTRSVEPDPAIRSKFITPELQKNAYDSLEAMMNRPTMSGLQIGTSLYPVEKYLSRVVNWSAREYALGTPFADIIEPPLGILQKSFKVLKIYIGNETNKKIDLDQLIAKVGKKISELQGEERKKVEKEEYEKTGKDDFGQKLQFDLFGVKDSTSIVSKIRDFLKALRSFDSVINVKQADSDGYLTSEFIDYLKNLAAKTPSGNPTSKEYRPPCDDVLYQGQSEVMPADGKTIFVDMQEFALALVPESFDPIDPKYQSGLDIENGATTDLACRKQSDEFKNLEPIQRGPAFTAQQAFDRFRRMNGTPLERYLTFIAFVYLFFDHIPEVRPVIASLLVPLVGMYNGIIDRGRFYSIENGPLALLKFYGSPEAIEDVTTFYKEPFAFSSTATRPDSVRAVLGMFRHTISSFHGIEALLREEKLPGDETLFMLGFIPEQSRKGIFNFILQEPIRETKPKGYDKLKKDAEDLYKSSGIEEFYLPSTGQAYNILPLILGIPLSSIVARVYSLTASWADKPDSYLATIDSIRDNVILRNEYLRRSVGRIGFTKRAFLTPNLEVPSSGNLSIGTKILILSSEPTQDGNEYLERGWPVVVDRRMYSLPRSWEELLYPGFISHAIVEAEIIKVICETIVRPCYQRENFSIAFSNSYEIDGGFVRSMDLAIDSDVDLFAAFFEFPAEVAWISSVSSPTSFDIKNVKFRYPGFSEEIPGSSGFTLSRSRRVGGTPAQKYSEKLHGTIEYRLVEALNASREAVPTKDDSVVAYSKKPLNIRTAAHYTPILMLKYRPRYLWTPLSPKAIHPPTDSTGVFKFLQPQNGNLFFPAIDPDFFLSSLFDWRLQLYYISILLQVVEGRTDCKNAEENILILFQEINKNDKNTLNELFDPANRDFEESYIKENVMRNLIEGPIPYSGLNNLIGNIVSPEVPRTLSDILEDPDFIDSTALTPDVKRFFVTNASPTSSTVGPLIYDIKIADYLLLMEARLKSGQVKSLSEKPKEKTARETREAVEKRELTVSAYLKLSKTRLEDPYSQIVDEIATRALYSS